MFQVQIGNAVLIRLTGLSGSESHRPETLDPF